MAGFLLDLRIALLNLVEHRRRTIFLGAAIAVATCAFVVMSALSAGVVQSVLETATALSTGHLNVGGFFKVTAGQVAPLVADYPRLSTVIEKSTPELELAVVRGRGLAKVISDQGSFETAIYGVDIAREPKLQRSLSLLSGSMEGLAEPNAIMIFDAHAKKLGVRVGDALTITAQTPRGAANTVDCHVVAVARDVGMLSQWSVFVPNDVIRALYQLNAQTAGVIQLHLKPEHLQELPAVAARLRKGLARAGYRIMPADTRPSWMKWQA
ncbi:MAG TPA: ABC transporter permease, partial [Polyangiaceae bacterium]|nr:ABC transporter permease [Polyangiaceae bacterium]